jgi:glyoxylase-like metal-dependent hydrolase (beta-lactamase superfamily II)
MNIGDLRIDCLSDGEWHTPEHFFGDHGGLHGDEIGADGIMRLPVAAFLVHTGGKRILIDAGLGPNRYDVETPQGRSVIWGGDLPARLAGVGVTPDDIDEVILTHLHPDHAGWLIQDERRFFPNATLTFGEGEWDENVVNSRNPKFREGMVAAREAGAVRLIERDGEVLPGISAMHTPGHTAGHTSFVLSSGDSRAIILGDIISCPLQILNSELEVVFDTDPQLGIQTRERILRELDGDMLVGGPHFPGLRFGRVLLAQGKRYWS